MQQLAFHVLFRENPPKGMNSNGKPRKCHYFICIQQKQFHHMGVHPQEVITAKL